MRKKEVLGQRFKIVSKGQYLERERRYAWDWSDKFREVEDCPRGRRLRELRHEVLEIGNFKNCRDRGVLGYTNEKET